MKHCAEKLACLTAIILGSTNVAEASDGVTDAQRKDTIAKVEACMQAGFRTYEYTLEAKKEKFRISATLQAQVKKKAPVLVGGKRFVRFINVPQSGIKHFDEVFVDDYGEGLIDKFRKDVTTKSRKQYSECFDVVPFYDDVVTSFEGMRKVEDCEADRYECYEEVECPNKCNVTQKTAQANYDYFLKEASTQCDERAKRDSGFQKRLLKNQARKKAVSPPHRKTPTKKRIRHR